MLPVVSNQVSSTENVMSKSCRVILSTFEDEFITLLPRPCQHSRAKAACVMEAYANIDFLWLTSKCLRIILCALGTYLFTQQQTRELIYGACVSISVDTMHRLSVAINSRRGRAGQRAGKAESQRNRKKNTSCQISFCRAVQLGTTDLLKSVFVLPSITCTCHCLYSTET